MGFLTSAQVAGFRRVLFSCLLLLGLCAAAPAAHAQDDPQNDPQVDPPAHVAWLDGSATIDRDSLSEPALPGTPLVPGDRLRISSGRVEILFPDGSVLDVDQYSSIELQDATQLRLVDGRVILTVAGVDNPTAAWAFRFDTPAGSIETFGPGEYRVDVRGGQGDTEVSVVRGSAAFITDVTSVTLGASERSVAWAGQAPSAPRLFNTARFDAFDQWAATRRNERLGSASSRYLPDDLRAYGGSFDRSGSWSQEPQYGNVWYPNVAADWNPYYDGVWSDVPYYGWTWVGVEPWAWPTHHYGRWGYARSRWFWIPGRSWAPAWVAWGTAPGYVSWSPLGFNNLPVFSFSVSLGGWRNGWTAISANYFGRPRYGVRQYSARSGFNWGGFRTVNAPPIRSRGGDRRWNGSNQGPWNVARRGNTGPGNNARRADSSRRPDGFPRTAAPRFPDATPRGSNRRAPGADARGVPRTNADIQRPGVNGARRPGGANERSIAPGTSAGPTDRRGDAQRAMRRGPDTANRPPSANPNSGPAVQPRDNSRDTRREMSGPGGGARSSDSIRAPRSSDRSGAPGARMRDGAAPRSSVRPESGGAPRANARPSDGGGGPRAGARPSERAGGNSQGRAPRAAAPRAAAPRASPGAPRSSGGGGAQPRSGPRGDGGSSSRGGGARRGPR